MQRYFDNVASKAGGRTPPPWHRDAVQLKGLLQGSWDEVSVNWVGELIDAVKAGNVAELQALLVKTNALGLDMAEALGSSHEAVTQNLALKADSFWTLYAASFGIADPALWQEQLRDEMATAVANQIKEFAGKYPSRILHEEIVNQVKYLTDTETPDPLKVAKLGEQLEKMLTDRPAYYWENMSDVHASRLWHTAGAEIAEANGIAVLKITGPLDKKTCVVCRHLIGLEFDVSDTLAFVRKGIDIEDPDEYVKYWKFPRFDDVDNKSIDERKKAVGPLPVPAHPRCRHGYSWARL